MALDKLIGIVYIKRVTYAPVAELADASDSKSDAHKACGFDSHREHNLGKMAERFKAAVY